MFVIMKKKLETQKLLVLYGILCITFIREQWPRQYSKAQIIEILIVVLYTNINILSKKL